jgi:hypothetical protein
MEEIKAPKKERKFLKAVGNIAKVLANELVMGIGRKFIGKAIDKVGNKRQGLVIAFALVAGISYASIDSIPYPITGNKQRLGFQTTGNGLVWRGTAADTVTKPTSYADKNIKAYLILDSVSGSLYVFKQGVWAAISGAGGFEQPIDSLFFNTSVPSNNVDTAKMRWDSDLGTIVLGMYDQVPNELGFKNFWLVKNQTGSIITKGSIVYANGTLGASGRITIDKFIADGSIDAKYLLGITAHDLSNGEDGYVISFGKIRKVNTDTFAAGAILYPSPTVAGVWTDVEPVAPFIDMPIGFCINSHVNNGTIAIRVASGYKLHELHDLAISSPVDKASLYYSGGLWRDTTPTLLVSDTAAMLANYATKAYADTTGRLYAREDFLNVSTSTLTWTQTDTLIPGVVTVVQVYRNGQILLPSQYTIPTSTSVVIAATSFKVGDNYTVIFPRGGGAGSGGGSGSLTSISAGTGIVVSPNPITTTGTVSADLTVMMELTDTTLLNLTTRFASKLNTTDTASLSSRIDAKGNGTVTSVATGYGLSGGTITTTGELVLDSAVVFSQIRDSIVDVAIGNDTIKILKQEYAPATTSVLTWTITPKFPIQLKQYILVFRNGQLLINDQYNLTDTNQITIVSNSFKIGSNYTVVTVSGIGSVGTGTFPNPVYPDAGIALSTGTTWASSITNNSTNWNTAYTDRLKWDGGSTGLVAATGRTSLGGTTIGQSMFTLTNPSAITFPRFNADNTVTARTAANFRSDIGAGTVTSVTASGTAGNPISITNTTTTPVIELLSATTGRNGYLTSTDWTTFNNKQNALSNASASVSGILTSTDWTTFNNKQPALGFTPANSTITINTTSPLQGGGNLTANRTFSILSASDIQSGIVNTTAQLFSGSKVFKHRLTADSLFYLNNTSPIPTAILGIDLTGGVNSVGKFTLGNGLSITSSTLLADTNLLITRYDTASMLTNYLRSGVAASTYQTKLNGTGFVKASGTTISYDNSTYLTTGTAASTYQTILTNPVTGTGTTNTLPLFTGASTLGNSVIQESSGNIGIGTTPIANLTFDVSKNILLKSGSTGIASILFSETGTPSSTDVEFGGILRYNGSLDRMELVTRDNLGGSNVTNTGITMDRITGNIGLLKPTTISSTLAVTGNITESGNNVLTNLDTASLSSRIDAKYNSTGGTISGTVTLSTTTATPTTLLGKDGSNVVGTVTTVAQTGLFGRGSVTNATTDANGNITVAHGFSFTPIMAFANLPGSTTNIVNVKEVNATNIVFVVRDGATNDVLNTISVTKIEFFAIK